MRGSTVIEEENLISLIIFGENFSYLPLQLMLLSSNTYVEPGFKLAVRSRVVGLRAVVEVRHTREVQP